jgi:hypothetical protein
MDVSNNGRLHATVMMEEVNFFRQLPMVNQSKLPPILIGSAP